jgi:hypothetical protein
MRGGCERLDANRPSMQAGGEGRETNPRERGGERNGQAHVSPPLSPPPSGMWDCAREPVSFDGARTVDGSGYATEQPYGQL